MRLCARVNDGRCLFPVSNNYLFGSGAKMFSLRLPFAGVKVLGVVVGGGGVMAIILIIIILKTSLQVIRGSLWRREPLKSISESYCFQWKIKPTQDCCDVAARLVCELWSLFGGDVRHVSAPPLLSFWLHRRAGNLPVAFQSHR